MKSNPRFVMTNIPGEGIVSGEGELLMSGTVESLYENCYCGRGNAENMIKQMVFDLHANRTSSSWMASNQMRLWFSTLAYLLLERVPPSEWLPLVGLMLLWALCGCGCSKWRPLWK
jgi:hypothetical protein